MSGGNSHRLIQGRGVGIGLGVGCGFGVGWGFGGGNLGVFGLGVGGGCGLGLGLGWGVGVGWGSKYINQHFVFEETTVTRRSNDDPPQVRNPVTSLIRGVKSTVSFGQNPAWK